MNRRAFMAAVPFLPSAVKAALAHSEPVTHPHYNAYHADGRGIHKLLEDCGKCVEPAPLDLDAIFERLYAIKSHRSDPVHLFVRNSHGQLVQVT